MRLPDFLIAGAPKCGTTTLYEVLASTPGISMSAAKEPRYFSRVVQDDAFFSTPVRDAGAYSRLWKGAAPKDVCGEATPTYFHDPGTPEAVAAEVPSARIVVAVRNPVERAYSHYRYHELRTGRSSESLMDVFERSQEAPVSDYHASYLLAPGFYASNLRRWLRYFPAEHVHIVVFEEMIEDLQHALKQLTEFLGVSPPERIYLGDRQTNSAREPKGRTVARLMQSDLLRRAARSAGVTQHARELGERLLTKKADAPKEVDRETLERIANLYEPDVRELSAILDRDLPWNLSSYAERS